MAAIVVKAKWKEHWDQGRAAISGDPALLDKLKHLVRAQSKIRLLLNPTEADYQRLNHAIDAAVKRLRSDELAESATEADIETITALAQSILKREWQRVKRGT